MLFSLHKSRSRHHLCFVQQQKFQTDQSNSQFEEFCFFSQEIQLASGIHRNALIVKPVFLPMMSPFSFPSPTAVRPSTPGCWWPRAAQHWSEGIASLHHPSVCSHWSHSYFSTVQLQCTALVGTPEIRLSLVEIGVFSRKGFWLGPVFTSRCLQISYAREAALCHAFIPGCGVLALIPAWMQRWNCHCLMGYFY